MSIRKGNDIIASKPLIDAVPTQSSTNAVSSGGVYDVIQKITRGGFYHPDLFDFKWTDHIVNDVQWLRADAFSWQSGAVYEAAFWDLFYDMQVSTYWYGSGGPAYTKSRTPAAGDAVYLNSDLTTQIGTVEAYDDVNDEITVSGDTYSYMSNTYVTPTTETVAGYTVTVYTGHSGKKIVGAGDESNVANIYTATGVAWYYIIDIPNKRFKLPRTKFGFTGLRDTVGNYVAESLPNITGAFDIPSYNTNNIAIVSSGAFSSAQTGGTARAIGYADQQYARGHTTLDASRSSSAYQDSAPVQQRATQMYLYFYVGEFTQTALENTAGIRAEDLNNKVDVGHQVIEFQAPTALNNYTWYYKYADGRVEQGGVLDFGSDNTAAGAALNITLPIAMADNHYYRNVMPGGNGAGAQYLGYCVVNTPGCTTTSLQGYWVKTETGGARYFYWEVKGMAA